MNDDMEKAQRILLAAMLKASKLTGAKKITAKWSEKSGAIDTLFAQIDIRHLADGKEVESP